MMLTRSSDYAMRALVHLAQCPQGKAERLDSIAKAQKVPPALLSKILQTLVRAGVIRSQKGYGGGYALVTDPKELTLREVVEHIDGPLVVFECLNDDQFCNLCQNCQLKAKFTQIQDTLLTMLGQTTLLDCIPSGGLVPHAVDVAAKGGNGTSQG